LQAAQVPAQTPSTFLSPPLESATFTPAKVSSKKSSSKSSSKAEQSSGSTSAPGASQKGGKPKTKKDANSAVKPASRSVSPTVSASAVQLPLTAPDTPVSATMDSDDDMQSVASSAGFMEDADSDVSLDDGKL